MEGRKMKRTLALIFAALALMIGSFIWFVASWDADKEQPIGLYAPDTPILTTAAEQYQTHTGPIPNPYGVL